MRQIGRSSREGVRQPRAILVGTQPDEFEPLRCLGSDFEGTLPNGARGTQDDQSLPLHRTKVSAREPEQERFGSRAARPYIGSTEVAMAPEDRTQGLTYRDSGVDIDAAEAALDRAKSAIRSTFNPRVLADVGSFGGLFHLAGLGNDPVLVASTDGVGTKVRIATAVGIWDTVGRDLVQHCINDILVQGASPLFFLDYLGTGRLHPERVAGAITGVARACADHNTVLLGGETAEMPGVYPNDEWDLAGTIVGWAERDAILDGSRVLEGDRLIGLPSDGLHTNGYSLARRIVEQVLEAEYTDPFPHGEGSWADVLLQPHRCYLGALQPLLNDPALHALAHITGGGLRGNLPRVLPDGLGVLVDRKAVPTQPIFQALVEAGGVPLEDAWRAFNMGVGLVLVVAAPNADRIFSDLVARGEAPFHMGEVDKAVDGLAWRE